LSASVEGNVFASTYSVHLLLLLLTIGSKSKTKDELVEVLRLPKNESPNYEEIKTVVESIEEPEYLSVANGIFSDKAFDLSADYENQARNYLKSEVKRLDFAGNPSVGQSEINEWAKNKTKGKISKILDTDSINKSTAMVLASAVHFQNAWKSPFAETKAAMFCLSAEEHIPIRMMHQTGYFKYYKDEHNKFAVLELPYDGGNFEMLVVLPDKMDGVTGLVQTILSDSTKFPILLANLTVHKVVLDLPMFKFESDLSLNEPMNNLGCGNMFTTAADFSAMSSSGAGKLKVNSVKHKSFVDVNESGTEAAGISIATLDGYSLEHFPSDVKTVKFHACHPFLFIIKKGSDVVFMGRMTNPNA